MELSPLIVKSNLKLSPACPIDLPFKLVFFILMYVTFFRRKLFLPHYNVQQYRVFSIDFNFSLVPGISLVPRTSVLCILTWNLPEEVKPSTSPSSSNFLYFPDSIPHLCFYVLIVNEQMPASKGVKYCCVFVFFLT